MRGRRGLPQRDGEVAALSRLIRPALSVALNNRAGLVCVPRTRST